MTPEKLAKLPKWAQQYITQLKRERDYAQAEYEAVKQTDSKCAVGESNVILNHARKDTEHVADGTRVRFLLDESDHWRNFIEVSMQDYRPGIPAIYLYGGGTIQIIPRASNCAYVKLMPVG